MKTLLYRSPFIPADLIRDHGWRPQHIVPSGPCPQNSPFPSAGVCPNAKAIAHAILTTPGDAIALTDTCDQMRRMAELIGAQTERPVFLMHVPRTTSLSSSAFYQSELSRLASFLDRNNTRDAYSPSCLPSPRVSLRPLSPSSPSTTNLALIGPGLWQSHQLLFEKVQEWGGRIAIDATTGSDLSSSASHCLSQSSAFRLHGTTQAEDWNQTDASSCPAIFTRPNDPFYAWLNSRLAQCNIRGILVVSYTWCDLWRAEIAHIKNTTGLPVLPLEIAEEPSLPERTLLHVQSFLEALR